ncbi:MAG: phosphoheptose isomerase [Desulfuromonas sp.]|nr:MAG: phosphoheptose isomerase [Desulfuromonas sp.]
MNQTVQQYLAGHNQAIGLIEGMADNIDRAGKLLVDTLRQGHKILVMGNGGSAADAQHLAAELVGRFEAERSGLPALALTTDSSILTAVSNDFGYEAVFARQVEALAVKGDVVIGISTSGHSPNVLQAVKTARGNGCRTIGLLGRDGGDIAAAVDLPLIVAVQQTPHIQEAHGVLVHLLCRIVDQAFSGKN